MNAMTTPIHSRIRDILLKDWDPSNASRFDAARHEYDGYLDSLAQLIESDADEEKIIDYLHQRELEIMCFPGLDHAPRLGPVARKLRDLRNKEQSIDGPPMHKNRKT
jgi:hypothetical protein